MGGYAAPPGGGEWSFGGQSGNTTTGANNSGYASAVAAANPGTTSVAPSGSYGGSSSPAPSPSYSTPSPSPRPSSSSGSSGSTIVSNTPVSTGLTTSQQMALASNPGVDVNNPNAVYYAIYGTAAPNVGATGNLAPYLPANVPTPPPTQYSTPTPTPTPTTQQAPTSYAMNRPDYYDPSTLGDTQTQSLVRSGMTIEQALNKQAAEASNSRAAAYYQNELQKSLGSNIALASEYHYQANLTGLPQAPNPYANVADLSLYTLKGVQGKDAAFSPTSYASLNLPNNGMGIQDVAWNKALGINTQANFTTPIDTIAAAKLSGDVGLYNTKNLQSYSSTYGVLDLATQQDIGRRVQASPSIGTNGWAINENISLPQPSQFGYGAGGFRPSYIQDNLKATSPIQGVVNTERVLGSYASAYDTKGNFSPSMTLLGAGVKLTDAQARMMDYGFDVAKNQSVDYFKSIPLGVVPVKSQSGLYFNSISKMETPVAQEKNFVDKGLDIAGGFVRSVGGMTEIGGLPNVVDFATKTAAVNLKYVNPVIGLTEALAGREGAQEQKGGSIYSRGEPLKYGEYSAAGREFSKNVIQPIVGVSPEQYEGYVKQAEIDYNRKGATFTDKSIAALSMVGNTANAWVVGKPDEVLTVGAQAAAIEVTGAFGLVGRGAELSLTKAAQVGRVAENPYVRGGINVVGKYGVDAAFGYGVAGEVTRGESKQTYGMDAGGNKYLISDTEGEWFGVRTVPQLAKNVGLTGAQLVVFTGGMYGAGSIGGGAKTGGGETTSAFKEGAPYQPKYTQPTGNTGGNFEGKTPSGNKGTPYEGYTYSAQGQPVKVVSTIDLLRQSGSAADLRTADLLEARMKKTGATTTGGGRGSYTFEAQPIKPYVDPTLVGKTSTKAEFGAGDVLQRFTNKQIQPSMEIKPIEVKPISQSYSRPQDLSTIKRVEPMIDVKDLTISKQKSYSKDITTKSIDAHLDIFKDKTKGISEYKSQKMDITEYKKTGTDMELYKRPVTDITKFKPKPTDITTPRKIPTDITPYRKPIVDITPYRRSPTNIVPKRPTPTDIVKYKDPITDITPYKKPPTEIVKYKDPFKDIVPRPRDEIIPRREEPAPKEKKLEKPGGGGGAPVGLPFGGFGGGGGSSGGGGARGGRHSTDIFKYGFGISGEIGIQVPKIKRGKK